MEKHESHLDLLSGLNAKHFISFRKPSIQCVPVPVPVHEQMKIKACQMKAYTRLQHSWKYLMASHNLNH